MPSHSNRRMKSTATVIVHQVSGDNHVRCILSSPGCLPRQGNFACQNRQIRDGPQNPFAHGTQRLKGFLSRSVGIVLSPGLLGCGATDMIWNRGPWLILPAQTHLNCQRCVSSMVRAGFNPETGWGIRADMLFPWLLLVYCGMNMDVGFQVMEHSMETWQDPVSGENAGCGKGSKWLWGAGLRLHSNPGRGSWHLGDFHLPEVGGPWPRAHIPLSDLADGCHFPELVLYSCLVLLQPLS